MTLKFSRTSLCTDGFRYKSGINSFANLLGLAEKLVNTVQVSSSSGYSFMMQNYGPTHYYSSAFNPSLSPQSSPPPPPTTPFLPSSLQSNLQTSSSLTSCIFHHVRKS